MEAITEPPAATISAKYEIHPAAELFPAMSPEELQGLVEDIKANGQREPATLWCGKLIDGRNRAKACEQLGIELQCCELDPDTDPIKWVLSYNLHRRHLSESQRAMVAARLKEFYAAEAKERQKRKPVDSVSDNCREQNGRASDQAGEALNVSGKSVERAAAVIAHGSDELVAAVDCGDVSVSKAEKIVKTTPKADQLRAATTSRKVAPPAANPTSKAVEACPECGGTEWATDNVEPGEFCKACKRPHEIDSPRKGSDQPDQAAIAESFRRKVVATFNQLKKECPAECRPIFAGRFRRIAKILRPAGGTK